MIPPTLMTILAHPDDESFPMGGALANLDYVDGQLETVPASAGAARLLELMRQSRPDVVVTFGPEGISGHPDHLAVHRWTTAAFDPYQQEVERPLRLYYIAPSEAKQQGCGVPPAAAAVGGPVAFIDVGDYLMQKVRAAQQPQSQNPPFSGDVETAVQEMACHELFRLARPQTAANGQEPETDLFTGLTGANHKTN